MSYPCTGIGSWWTTVQFCPVEPEIEGNQPLQDGSSEHFGSRAASSPLGQCQLWNRTVVQRGERVVLDSASYEIGQSVQWAWIGPGGMVGRCREVLPGGIRAPGGDGFCGLADLVPEGRRRRCVPLPSRGQGRCGVGREVLGHGGTGELAEGDGDVVGHPGHEHSHVITCQT